MAEITFHQYIRTSSRKKRGYYTFQKSEAITEELEEKLGALSNYEATRSREGRPETIEEYPKLYGWLELKEYYVLIYSKYLGNDLHSARPRSGNYIAYCWLCDKNNHAFLSCSPWALYDQIPDYSIEDIERLEAESTPFIIESKLISTNNLQSNITAGALEKITSDKKRIAMLSFILDKLIKGDNIVLLDQREYLCIWTQAILTLLPPQYATKYLPHASFASKINLLDHCRLVCYENVDPMKDRAKEWAESRGFIYINPSLFREDNITTEDACLYAIEACKSLDSQNRLQAFTEGVFHKVQVGHLNKEGIKVDDASEDFDVAVHIYGKLKEIEENDSIQDALNDAYDFWLKHFNERELLYSIIKEREDSSSFQVDFAEKILWGGGNRDETQIFQEIYKNLGGDIVREMLTQDRLRQYGDQVLVIYNRNFPLYDDAEINKILIAYLIDKSTSWRELKTFTGPLRKLDDDTKDKVEDIIAKGEKGEKIAQLKGSGVCSAEDIEFIVSNSLKGEFKLSWTNFFGLLDSKKDAILALLVENQIIGIESPLAINTLDVLGEINEQTASNIRKKIHDDYRDRSIEQYLKNLYRHTKLHDKITSIILCHSKDENPAPNIQVDILHLLIESKQDNVKTYLDILNGYELRYQQEILDKLDQKLVPFYRQTKEFINHKLRSIKEQIRAEEEERHAIMHKQKSEELRARREEAVNPEIRQSDQNNSSIVDHTSNSPQKQDNQAIIENEQTTSTTNTSLQDVLNTNFKLDYHTIGEIIDLLKFTDLEDWLEQSKANNPYRANALVTELFIYLSYRQTHDKKNFSPNESDLISKVLSVMSVIDKSPLIKNSIVSEYASYRVTLFPMPQKIEWPTQIKNLILPRRDVVSTQHPKYSIWDYKKLLDHNKIVNYFYTESTAIDLLGCMSQDINTESLPHFKQQSAMMTLSKKKITISSHLAIEIYIALIISPKSLNGRKVSRHLKQDFWNSYIEQHIKDYEQYFRMRLALYNIPFSGDELNDNEVDKHTANE